MPYVYHHTPYLLFTCLYQFGLEQYQYQLVLET